MGRGREQALIEDFLDNIDDEKFSGWSDREYTIVKDFNLGFRLDHQGLNNNPDTKPHRIFVQPVAFGHCKSRVSRHFRGTVLAQVHCDDLEDAEAVRDGLKESAKESGKLVVV